MRTASRSGPWTSIGAIGTAPSSVGTGTEALAVRLGWSLVKGLSQGAADTLVHARRSGCFTSYNDFVRRTAFTAATLTRLASADAFRSLGLGRRPALWQSLEPTDALPLFANLADEAPPALPRLSSAQEVIHDYQAQGLSLRGHPIAPFRAALAAKGIITAAELQTAEADRHYRVAGLVLLRQRPGTAKGVTFMTIEDETGTANLIVWRRIWERFRRVARLARALVATGLLQRQDGVTHLVVRRLEDITEAVADLRQASRDFR